MQYTSTKLCQHFSLGKPKVALNIKVVSSALTWDFTRIFAQMVVKYRRKALTRMTMIWSTLKCFVKMIYNFVVGSTIDGSPQTSLLSVLNSGTPNLIHNQHITSAITVTEGWRESKVTKPDSFVKIDCFLCSNSRDQLPLLCYSLVDEGCNRDKAWRSTRDTRRCSSSSNYWSNSGPHSQKWLLSHRHPCCRRRLASEEQATPLSWTWRCRWSRISRTWCGISQSGRSSGYCLAAFGMWSLWALYERLGDSVCSTAEYWILSWR